MQYNDFSTQQSLTVMNPNDAQLSHSFTWFNWSLTSSAFNCHDKQIVKNKTSRKHFSVYIFKFELLFLFVRSFIQRDDEHQTKIQVELFEELKRVIFSRTN